MLAISKAYITEIKQILKEARAKAYAAVNYSMVEAYWLIGKRIVEEIQQGGNRANYGEQVIKNLSKALTVEFGKGFSDRSIRQYRQFYQTFPKLPIMRTMIAETTKPDKTIKSIKDKKNSAISDRTIKKTTKGKANLAISDRQINNSSIPWSLNWTHIQRIMRVSNTEARAWYLKEAAEQSWDVRTLDRNISTQYYERLLISQVKKPVVKEMQTKTKKYQKDKLEFIKNPSVLEFLGLPGNTGYSEAVLEKTVINHLQQFILELGKGFAFVERQQLLRTETSDYYVDLVFYNYILKCFVLIDLKTTRITHQDVGQMDMYVRMYDELKRNEDDNPTIGILLCSETDKDIARYSILKGNEHLFATKYKLYLPTEEELRIEIEREKEFIRLQLDKDKKEE
ncbi:MAG: PDDEXK nuclease domain-containing protein [Treponema sp.]|nr:PDDEXK nuclease domain-containing protein [Treponema sp.]MCL2237631.1 PDDEXK nuclease domain-containing protein [Treponema sp.]